MTEEMTADEYREAIRALGVKAILDGSVTFEEAIVCLRAETVRLLAMQKNSDDWPDDQTP